MPTLRELVAKAKRFYPNSKAMRKQWVRQSLNLYQSGTHLINLGQWPNGRF